MINLLPPEFAARNHFGRINSILRLWLFGMALAIGGLVVIIFSGWLYLDKQTRDLSEDINNGQRELQRQNLPQVQKDAKEISSDIKVINQVLGREVSFSDIMQSIGKVMPQHTVLSNLTLSKISGAIDLSANAKDYSSAAQIAVNLNDPKNDLFTSVDIVNITCGNDDKAVYKCTAQFKALFSKSAQTRFLSVPKGGQ